MCVPVYADFPYKDDDPSRVFTAKDRLMKGFSFVAVLLQKIELKVSSPISAPSSKTEVSTTIKHSRYFHLTSTFRSIHYCCKRFHVSMSNVVDTTFSYERALIVC